MKRDVRQTALSASVEVLKQQIKELGTQFLQARQEKFVQDKSAVNMRRAYTIRKHIKMLKAELTRRERTTA